MLTLSSGTGIFISYWIETPGVDSRRNRSSLDLQFMAKHSTSVSLRYECPLRQILAERDVLAWDLIEEDQEIIR